MSEDLRAAVMRNSGALFRSANAIRPKPSLVAAFRNERLYVVTPDDPRRVPIRVVLDDGHPPMEHEFLRDVIPVNPLTAEWFAEIVPQTLEAR